MLVDVIHIAVDLTESGRRLLHAVVDLPVKPATTALFATPLWVQEHHAANVNACSFVIPLPSSGIWPNSH